MSPALLCAVAEDFVTKLPLARTAEIYDVPPSDLHNALQVHFQHTWRGKLVAALEKPDVRPDLIPHYTELARLEEHYGILMHQFHRAEETCASMRNHQDPLPYVLLMKADAFANRIQQQCMKALKDLQKAETQLKKAAAILPTETNAENPDSTDTPTLASGGRKSPESPNQPEPPTQPEVSARSTDPRSQPNAPATAAAPQSQPEGSARTPSADQPTLQLFENGHKERSPTAQSLAQQTGRAA